MQPRHRLIALLAAAALTFAAGCSSAVEGSAEAAADQVPTTEEAAEETSDTEPADVEPSEDPGASEPSEETAVEPPVDETPEPGIEIDEATLVWADGACMDMLSLIDAIFDTSLLTSDGTVRGDGVAQIDYLIALGETVDGLLVDVQDRAAPGIPKGEELHRAYVEQLSAISDISESSAQEIELLLRSGSDDDVRAALDGAQLAISEAISADLAGDLLGGTEMADLLDEAMTVAPSCAELS